MIDQADWVLVGGLVLAAVTITSFLWIVYHAQMVWDLKLENQRRLEEMNAEIAMVRSKLKDNEMQARVMGSVPVSRLIHE